MGRKDKKTRKVMGWVTAKVRSGMGRSTGEGALDAVIQAIQRSDGDCRGRGLLTEADEDGFILCSVCGDEWSGFDPETEAHRVPEHVPLQRRERGIIWWTSPADCEAIGTARDDWPLGLRADYTERRDRSGEGRFWEEDLLIGVASTFWPGSPMARALVRINAAGIALPPDHAAFVLGLPGFLTTSDLHVFPGQLGVSPPDER